MGDTAAFIPEKLVVGILVNPKKTGVRPVREALEKRFGPADYFSPEIVFDFTDYYEGEMGAPLSRYFASFERCVNPETLAAIKLKTNRLEKEWHDEKGNRSVNLDPGLLTEARLTLASTKNNAHRIPLDRGIYAELTLLFRRGEWTAMPWTYPDFRTEEYAKVLNTVRERYREQLRRGSPRVEDCAS